MPSTAPRPSTWAGAKRVVMQPGRKGTLSDCGNWLTGVLPIDGKLVGLVHGESDCDYDKGRTHKAMAIATSADEGLTWTFLGAIITHTDAATAGKMTGEGDCTMADGGDGFLYVYCLRPVDWTITASRARARQYRARAMDEMGRCRLAPARARSRRHSSRWISPATAPRSLRRRSSCCCWR